MSLKPICVACRCFYRPEKNGYMFMEGMPKSYGELGDTTPEERRGNRRPDLWEPYKLWRGDLWMCPECGHQIVVGIAHDPIREHYMPDFNAVVEALHPEIQINDC